MYPNFDQWRSVTTTMPGAVRALPGWARVLVFIAALPGLALLALSLLAFVVSLLALLLLTVPVYSLVRGLTGGVGRGSPVQTERQESGSSPGSKRVEATILE